MTNGAHHLRRYLALERADDAQPYITATVVTHAGATYTVIRSFIWWHMNGSRAMEREASDRAHGVMHACHDNNDQLLHDHIDRAWLSYGVARDS